MDCLLDLFILGLHLNLHVMFGHNFHSL